MTLDRRQFVLGSLAAAACGTRKQTAPPSPATREAAAPAAGPAGATKRTVLVLGGTKFLGPHVVTAALARGHTVTLFNRGKTNPQLFPDVEKLRGDRDGDLQALAGRSWDAVIDDTGYTPRAVTASAGLLAPRVGHYLFVSTISVYKDGAPVGADETALLRELADPTTEDVGKHYGELKAACERAAEAAMPGRVAIVRPGLIVGPGDPTGRFTHWPARMQDGGEVLGPGDGTTPTQWIDGRDLGAWIVHLVEQRTTGIYNAFGAGVAMKTVLDACNAAAGGKATITWVDAAFLDAHHVAGWSELPMWIDNRGDEAGFGTRSNARAVAAGLVTRPIADTAKATLEWLDTLPADERARVRSSGITRDKEARVLAAWKARR